MKKIITLLALSFSAIACADAPVFTTLASSQKHVYAGVKLEEKGNEPETYLFQLTEGDVINKISLPKELIHREIVSIYPANEKEILVLTQRTVEQGDAPLLYSFTPANTSWKKIGSVDCMSFAKVAYEKNAVKLTCLKTNEKGDEVQEEKEIPLKGIAVSAPKEITLPVHKVENGDLKAELIGDSFEWKELKVLQGKKEKKFKPL